MMVCGNALTIWSTRIPNYAVALDRETATTTVTEIERNNASYEYTDAPDNAQTHDSSETHRRREVASTYAAGRTAEVETVHCPKCKKRIANVTLPSLSRWLCACGYVIHREVMTSLGWPARPVDHVHGKTKVERTSELKSEPDEKRHKAKREFCPNRPAKSLITRSRPDTYPREFWPSSRNPQEFCPFS